MFPVKASQQRGNCSRAGSPGARAVGVGYVEGSGQALLDEFGRRDEQLGAGKNHYPALEQQAAVAAPACQPGAVYMGHGDGGGHGGAQDDQRGEPGGHLGSLDHGERLEQVKHKQLSHRLARVHQGGSEGYDEEDQHHEDPWTSPGPAPDQAHADQGQGEDRIAHEGGAALTGEDALGRRHIEVALGIGEDVGRVLGHVVSERTGGLHEGLPVVEEEGTEEEQARPGADEAKTEGAPGQSCEAGCPLR